MHAGPPQLVSSSRWHTVVRLAAKGAGGVTPCAAGEGWGKPISRQMVTSFLVSEERGTTTVTCFGE